MLTGIVIGRSRPAYHVAAIENYMHTCHADPELFVWTVTTRNIVADFRRERIDLKSITNSAMRHYGHGVSSVDLADVVVSSALVSTVAGSVSGLLAQRVQARYQAQVDYELGARRRLYEAIGPLKFQLVIAARDVIRRVNGHHTRPWDMSAEGYYVQSFVYRVLRPLAIFTLVEQQMSYADFSVDPVGYEVLKFEVAVYRMLTGDDPLPFYSSIERNSQTQHVFRDNLRREATWLIEKNPDGRHAVITYARFIEKSDDVGRVSLLQPIVELFSGCTKNLTENAVWWVRLVGYAYACECFLEQQPARLGAIAARSLDVRAALEATGDRQVVAHLSEYPGLYKTILDEGI